MIGKSGERVSGISVLPARYDDDDDDDDIYYFKINALTIFFKTKNNIIRLRLKQL